MKKLTKYQCETCKTLYTHRESAARCEESHNKLEDVAGLRFEAGESTPKFLDLVFTDNQGHAKLARYSREEVFF